ncbi:hypothetical protein EDC65_2484 [Stella humosa]|uniref:Uncharacterized protein n=2 Tax=Stella humosa TaxID=94 RepID=A0A3N1LGT8_9PROT|nr:hypothetical protein EDC65_2484 [Stella humosa]BBK29471.1 hypothetical protein STHU_01050 [Stella humosa]
MLLSVVAPGRTAAQEADPITAASQAIADVLVPIGLARGLVSACDGRDPGGQPARADAHRRWRQANGVDGFEAAMTAVQAKAPELAIGRARLEDASRSQASEAIERDPAACQDLPRVLDGQRFRIAHVTADAEAVLRNLAGPRPEAPPAPAERAPTPADRPRQVYGPGQLSALAQAAMAGLPPGQGRTAAARRTLAALGPIAVRGRAVDGSRLHEWRNGRRAAFAVACTFADRRERQRFARERDRETVVVGRVRQVAAGGTIGLHGCRLDPAAARLPDAAVDADAGFEPAPR